MTNRWKLCNDLISNLKSGFAFGIPPILLIIVKTRNVKLQCNFIVELFNS